MKYRSFTDLARVVRDNIGAVPDDVDLVVGVPRSGMPPASFIALNKNIDLCDIGAFLANRPLGRGITRSGKTRDMLLPFDAKHVLVVDDSIHTGATMKGIRDQIERVNPSARVTFAAIYAAKPLPGVVDVIFEMVSGPRVFEWNVMHLPSVGDFCFDIDGVLCRDPEEAENDDGEAYRHFLANAEPLVMPTHEIGHLVTSRLEKYRSETEAWFASRNIRFKALHMLDLPDAQTRKKLGNHASFKAGVYRNLKDSPLFIESDPLQAKKIAEMSGKVVLCYTTQELHQPIANTAHARQVSRRLRQRVGNKLKRTLGFSR